MTTSSALMPTYARLPVRFVRGEGCRLWDEAGLEYLDALSGIGVCGLGHAHPAIADALCDQARTLIHTSNLYQIPLQEALGEELTALAGMEQVFFANSGAEANEAAIKLARLYGHGRGIDNPHILVTDGSFHGRTLATLTATGNRKVQAGFEPLVRGFVRVPFDDLEAVRTVADNHEQVVAVLVEPIQGEGGVKLPQADYLAGLRALCDERGWLLMLDEVQTGMGRTGNWFAFQSSGIRPDVLTLAKGLGNGVPIGACLVRGPAADVLGPGRHGSTFGGNPLACRAALAVIEEIRRQDLCGRARALGQRMLDGLRERLAGSEGVVSIRGRGLMLAVELDRPCGELVGQALQRGLLINVTAERVVRLLPPLILAEAEAERIVEEVGALVGGFLEQAA
ncbi:aspartate aminotransferase family protein [Thiohalobacter sp. IOR34]|uniref:aspartate aminotransferase family protein n=1 Tax=Thiohalobacter sp. IOR34 TaxID=3057176 RepID=UPI0025AF923D|nr:aspartate aminotransferase family protein [Thiohalobacter sp. IOR34]WJW76028.1 aspartate aminotransferase family protein [Thiohalobacter sp. IOR34]